MELRQLRHFMAVAETGNISKAAQKMFLTQPALSRQIKSLEEEIGQSLFERQPHSVKLTAAGETLMHDARELLQHADQVLERVRVSGGGTRLRVGYAPSLAGGLLSCAVENFVKKHPDARVELLDLSTQEILSGLEADALDVAVTVRPKRDSRGLQWTPLAKVSWQLAVNRHHALADLERIRPEEVAGEPLLVFSRTEYPEYWNEIAVWLRGHQQQRFSIGGEYDGVNSLLAAVESGLGIAVVTSGSMRFVPERVRLKEIHGAPEPLKIAAGHRPDRMGEKFFQVFIDELLNAAATMA